MCVNEVNDVMEQLFWVLVTKSLLFLPRVTPEQWGHCAAAYRQHEWSFVVSRAQVITPGIYDSRVWNHVPVYRKN